MLINIYRNPTNPTNARRLYGWNMIRPKAGREKERKEDKIKEKEK